MTRFPKAPGDGVTDIHRLVLLAVWFLWLLQMPAPAFALDPSRALTQYLHRIWQVQQGLPQATVCCVIQTRDGYVWMGTQAGLVRFDGVRFVSVDLTPDLPPHKTWVRDLQEDGSGALWVATQDRGVIRIAEGEVKPFSQGLPSQSVSRLCFDNAGHLWAATAAGVARWDGAGFAAVKSDAASSFTDGSPICRARDGGVWMSSADLRVTRYGGGASPPLALHTIPAQSTINALLETDDGALWVGTSGGLVWCRGGVERLFTRADGLADNWVTCLLAGRDGLWVGTKDGFSRIRDGEVECFRTKDGLSQSTVYSLCEDREGSLWVGTKHGLNQFLDRRTVPFTVSEGLPSNDSGPIFQDASGGLWIGTLGAGLSRFDGRLFHTLTPQQHLCSDTIFALADDPSGDLWVGTDRGVNRLHDGTVAQTLNAADGLPSPVVHCLLRDSTGALWAGTAAGPALYERGRFVVPQALAPLAGMNVLALAARADGSVFISTGGGALWTFAQGELHPVSQGSLPPRDINAFFDDGPALLWMGTAGGGVRLLNEGKVFSFSVSDGLVDDDVCGIAADADGRLWMACSEGVFWVLRSDLLKFAAGQIKTFPSTPFSPLDALRTIECRSGISPAVFRMRDGRLWFSTTHGAIVFDPARLHLTIAPMPLLVEEAIVDGKSGPADRVRDLPPGQHNIEFRYAGLSFMSPTRITYRYRLEGFDKDWIDAGARREAFYTNLPAGRFRFRVMATNIDAGEAAAAVPVNFEIAAHLYQKPWFLAACVFAALAAARLVYRLRMRRVRDQVQSILSERSRIARELHDTLMQGFAGVTMEMQALSSRLPGAEEQSRLQEIISDAGKCLRDARRSVAGLRGSEGSGSGLAASVGQAARQLTEARGIRLKTDLQPSLPSLPPETEYHLLRIAQEAVANAVKHSGARGIEVSLNLSADAVRLCVQDDGAGMTPDAEGSAASHYGLIGMRERAVLIGAQLRIDTGPGRGTSIRVVLPVRKEAGGTTAPAGLEGAKA